MSAVKTSKKRKYTKCSYDFVQFKRMIGKGLAKQWGGIVSDKKAMANAVTVIKEKIIDSKQKFDSIGMTGIMNDGIIYIFKNVPNLHAINAVTYSMIKKNNISMSVNVIQYVKLTKAEIAGLIS